MHRQVPRKGERVIFNSRYADLLVRVKNLVPQQLQKRYYHTRGLERMLADGGTIKVLPAKEQRKRLQERLDNPQEAPEASQGRPRGPKAISTRKPSRLLSAKPAPSMPLGDSSQYRWLVDSILVETLEGLRMQPDWSGKI